MQRIACGLSVLAIALIAGCGGGGGTSGLIDYTETLSSPPSEMLGTWNVENLGVPNDEITVKDDGEVIIEVTDPQTLSATLSADEIQIGTCDSSGVLTLSGGWTVDGVVHTIEASGTIDPDCDRLSLCATLTEAETVVYRNITVSGTKACETSDEQCDTATPPSPPSDLDTDDTEGLDSPPPPPCLSSTDSCEAPPPPPTF